MPSYIVKCACDKDQYVYWSDIVDSPLGWGTREELEELFVLSNKDESVEDRFKRVDETGTSALWPNEQDPAYGWNDPGFVFEQEGFLPRENLWELCQRLFTGESLDDLFRPFEKN